MQTFSASQKVVGSNPGVSVSTWKTPEGLEVLGLATIQVNLATACQKLGRLKVEQLIFSINMVRLNTFQLLPCSSCNSLSGDFTGFFFWHRSCFGNKLLGYVTKLVGFYKKYGILNPRSLLKSL